MAIGNPVFAVGQYTVTYNSVAIGLMQGDDKVPTLKPTNLAFNVESTDSFGKTLIESFHMGYNWQCQFTMIEWLTTQQAVLFPFAAMGTIGVIGAAYTGLAKALVLTAVSGTPAAVSGPATITANYAILAPNNNPALMFGPILRNSPVLLNLYPYLNSTTPIHFTKT